jgi:hypothetical protein
LLGAAGHATVNGGIRKRQTTRLRLVALGVRADHHRLHHLRPEVRVEQMSSA